MRTKKPKKKIKHISLRSLRKKAWKLQSEYIRRSAKGVCFTCGDKRSWKGQQAGHYIHKDCLDFDLININCQCVRCNKWLSGNLGVYAERLIAEYGGEAINALRQRANEVKKFTIFELQEIILSYKQRIKELNNP